MKTIIKDAELTGKILAALKTWADLYTKRRGGEFFGTPRYSQLQFDLVGDKLDKVFYLESTQDEFYVAIKDLTEDEEKYLYGLFIGHAAWDTYKALRNEYLAEHYPMISLR